MPLFPLPISDAVLLPHSILPVLFDPEHRAMVNDCLDQAGLLAVATLACNDWDPGDGESPPLRPVVCVGHIIQHEAIMDGRHNILLHGVCRARIVNVLESGDSQPYLTAELVPIERVTDDPPPMTELRRELRGLLAGPRLKRLRSVDAVIEWFDRDDIPTQALLELIGFTLVKDHELKYRLLAEPDADKRAGLIKRELCCIDRMIGRAERLCNCTWPKGMSWN
jgi:uncharacterized protein